MRYITINHDTYHGLKRAYNVAVGLKHKSFNHENKFFLTSYAKYVLEYLEDKLKIKGAHNVL